MSFTFYFAVLKEKLQRACGAVQTIFCYNFQGVFNQKNSISSFCRVPNAAWKAISIEYNSKDNVSVRREILTLASFRYCLIDFMTRVFARRSAREASSSCENVGKILNIAEISIPPPCTAERNFKVTDIL